MNNLLKCHPGIYCRDPFIHAFEPLEFVEQWVPGTTPGMTFEFVDGQKQTGGLAAQSLRERDFLLRDELEQRGRALLGLLDAALDGRGDVAGLLDPLAIAAQRLG